MRLTLFGWHFFGVLIVLSTSFPVSAYAQEEDLVSSQLQEEEVVTEAPLVEQSEEDSSIDEQIEIPLIDVVSVPTQSSEESTDVDTGSPLETAPIQNAEFVAVDTRVTQTEQDIAVQEEVKQVEMLAVQEEIDVVQQHSPFILISTSTFAINTIPEFVFVFEDKKSLIDTTLTTLGDTAQNLYEESFVETIVETVVSVVEAVVDFVLPEAQGEELSVVSSDEGHVPTVQNESTASIPEHSVLIGETTTEVDGTVPIVSEMAPISTTSVTEASSTELLAPRLSFPYALVDGTVVPVTVSHTEEGVRVRLEGVFYVGPHATFIYLIHNEEEMVIPLVFSVEGRVLFSLPLYNTYVAVVIEDTLGVRTLWLQNYASGTVQSFEKIVSGEYLGEGNTFTFKEETLFWEVPALAVIMGFDVVSKSSFSQTLNTQSSQKNILELETGDFEVRRGNGVVDLRKIPEIKIP